MWLTIALLSAIFFGIVHVMDSYCVDHVLEKPFIGMITSAIASSVVFLAIPFTLPILVPIQMPSIKIIVFCLSAGALIQINQALYFKALSYSEAGTVAGYWNMVPAFLPIVSFFYFGEVLEDSNYIGLYLIVMASVGLCLLDNKTKGSFVAFLLILFGTSLQITALLLMKIIFDEIQYFVGFILITTGMILMGLSPLMLQNFRRVFVSNLTKLAPAMHLFIIVEIVNLLAYGFLEKAIHIGGNPSLVAAIDATTSGFTFIFSIFFFFVSKKFGDIRSQENLGLKFINVGVMVMGVLMVS